jgi:hypothetical protein
VLPGWRATGTLSLLGALSLLPRPSSLLSSSLLSRSLLPRSLLPRSLLSRSLLPGDRSLLSLEVVHSCLLSRTLSAVK